MYSLFWVAVLRPEAGLFEASDGGGSSSTGGVLPRSDACEEDLEATGLVLCKCIVDDHPVGHGLCSFVIDYLVNGPDASALHDTTAALDALSGFDKALADSWRALVEEPEVASDLGMTFDDFDDEAAAEYVTADNVPTAVLQGCTRRLMGGRQHAFSALRRGFLRCEDLQLQLSVLGTAPDLSLLLQGKQTLTTAELLECFVLPCSWSEEESVTSGFADAGATVHELFVELLQDEETFDETRRFAMLRWATALHALPVGGLKDEKVRLRLFGPEPDDSTLPEVHTCTRELHLPNYSSLEVLREKVVLALEHAEDGFGKE